MKRCLVLVGFALSLPGPASAAASREKASSGHVRAELVAETTALVAGQRNWVGLRLAHQPHWHTYWINPGDSGLPTKLTWRLPATVTAGEIAWPAPRRFEVGGLFNFGYGGDVVLLIPLDVAGAAKPGARVELVADARWLVCREECVPGKATVKLKLPVAARASPDPRTRKLFAAAHAAQPVASSWSGQAHLAGDRIEVTLSGENLPPAESLDVFVVQRQVVAYARPQIVAGDGGVNLTFAKSEYLTGAPVALDLIVIDGRPPEAHARSVTVPFAASAAAADPPSANP